MVTQLKEPEQALQAPQSAQVPVSVPTDAPYVPETFQLKGDGQQAIRVMVAMCVRGEIHVSTAQSLWASSSPTLGIHFQTEADALVSRSRSVMMESFLRNPSVGDVLIFVDSDIVWPPGALEKLARACLETGDIVCGLYPVRDTANPHVALRLFPGQKVEVGEDGKVLTEVMYAATGFMAVHRRVVEGVAAELPLVFSGPREFHPFFLCFIADDGEMLSEDYAFCDRASQLGHRVWLDRSIMLGHQGLRTYTVRDLQYDAGMQVQQLTIDEGGPDRTDILGDLAAYLGITRQEAWTKVRATPFREALAKEWAEKAPRVPAEVRRFYQETDGYLLECAKFNLMRGYGARTYQAAGAKGKVVDFGGGIGTLAIELAKSRAGEVCMVELPSKHRDFAAFRFRRQGLNIPIYDSLKDVPEGQDSVVATDVMEHIHPLELPVVISEVARVLRIGGSFIPINDFEHAPDLPQHYGTEGLFAALCEQAGFEQVGKVLWVKQAGT